MHIPQYLTSFSSAAFFSFGPLPVITAGVLLSSRAAAVSTPLFEALAGIFSFWRLYFRFRIEVASNLCAFVEIFFVRDRFPA